MNRRRADAREGMDVAARVGLVAYGVLHLVVAWLAVELARGDRHRDYSGQGALRQLASHPLGRGLVWAIAVGMLGFCVQRVVQGFTDQDGRLRAWTKAVVYAVVGTSAALVASGSGGGGSGKERTLSARVMDLPGGQVLIVLVGVAILAVGVYQAYRGLSQDFREELSGDGRRGRSGTAYVAFGQVGYTAKGVVIALVGVLIGYAGISHDPQKSGGLDEALRTVRDQPFGPTLLIAVAAGIGCYGLFCFAQARHLSGHLSG